jgi:hypothetical protein
VLRRPGLPSLHLPDPMRFILLALMLQSPGQSSAAATLALEVDGVRWGEFHKMASTEDERPTLTLEKGRIRCGFLEIFWLDEQLETANALTVGEHRLDPQACRPGQVTVKQTLGAGRRGRERSWALIDACPVAWEISAVDEDGSILQLKSLTLTARQLAAAR